MKLNMSELEEYIEWGIRATCLGDVLNLVERVCITISENHKEEGRDEASTKWLAAADAIEALQQSDAIEEIDLSELSSDEENDEAGNG